MSDWSKVSLPVKMMMPIFALVSVSSFEKAGIGKRKVFEGQFAGLARIFRLPILLQPKDNAIQY